MSSSASGVSTKTHGAASMGAGAVGAGGARVASSGYVRSSSSSRRGCAPGLGTYERGSGCVTGGGGRNGALELSTGTAKKSCGRLATNAEPAPARPPRALLASRMPTPGPPLEARVGAGPVYPPAPAACASAS